MMRYFIYFLGFVILISCSKSRTYQKNLLGKWEVTLVKLQNSEGFSFYDYAPVGEISIEEDKVISGTIYSVFSELNGTQFDTLQLSGNYFLAQKNELFCIVQGQDTLESRLLLATNTDLDFEYYNALESKRVRYIFKKK